MSMGGVPLSLGPQKVLGAYGGAKNQLKIQNFEIYHKINLKTQPKLHISSYF